jgi:hypothetical protein
LKDAVLLVMANKQDLPNAMSTQELRNSCAAARERGSWGWGQELVQKLGLNSLGKYRRKWLVQDAPFRTVPHRSAPFRTVPQRAS